MLLFVPVRTDAYRERFPLGTVLLILANVAVFFLIRSGSIEDLSGWVLIYGELSPAQWFTSVFTHFGWLHLIGNMVFLWCFGQVVEGVAGFWRFLGLYLLIGALQCGLEQGLVLLASPASGSPEVIGISYGASAAIFGLLAVAMVWAPRTRIDTLFVYWVIVVAGARIGRVSLLVLGTAYLGLEGVGACLGATELASGGQLPVTSALLHLSGAAVGLPLALVLLRLNAVDCGGWDYFSRRQRRAGSTGPVEIARKGWVPPPERVAGRSE